jgi:AraC-like DNA-binding protein
LTTPLGTKSPTVSNGIIKFRLAIAERYGGKTESILHNAGVNPKELSDEEGRISIQKECAIWREIVRETGRQDIGLICGEVFPIQVTSVLGFVIMNAPTLISAIEKMVEYQKLIGDSMGLCIRRNGSHTFFEIDIWCDWVDELRYTVDVFVGAIRSWVRNNSVNQVMPFRVGFSHPHTVEQQAYIRHFTPTPVDLNVGNTYLAYSTKDLEAKVMCSNPSMFAAFDRQADLKLKKLENLHTISGRVRHLVSKTMNGNLLTLEGTARELAMSSRSLQAKLKLESTSYQEILNEIRLEVAKHYIRKKLGNFADIAFLLGYSEVSAFSRSFKKWTGLSPKQYAVNCEREV